MNRNRPGFMIVQMLVVIGLMAAFIIVAERVFRLSVQTSARAATEQETLLRRERAITALRDDVWRARKIDVPDKTTARFTGDGWEATWATAADGTVVRTQNDGVRQTWNALNVEFERQQPFLAVRQSGVEIALLRPAPRTNGGAQ